METVLARKIQFRNWVVWAHSWIAVVFPLADTTFSCTDSPPILLQIILFTTTSLFQSIFSLFSCSVASRETGETAKYSLFLALSPVSTLVREYSELMTESESNYTLCNNLFHDLSVVEVLLEK